MYARRAGLNKHTRMHHQGLPATLVGPHNDPEEASPPQAIVKAPMRNPPFVRPGRSRAQALLRRESPGRRLGSQGRQAPRLCSRAGVDLRPGPRAPGYVQQPVPVNQERWCLPPDNRVGDIFHGQLHPLPGMGIEGWTPGGQTGRLYQQETLSFVVCPVGDGPQNPGRSPRLAPGALLPILSLAEGELDRLGQRHGRRGPEVEC